MSDAWKELQAMKSKQNSYRERLEKRKKERQDILGASLGVPLSAEGSPGTIRSVPSPCTIKNENCKSCFVHLVCYIIVLKFFHIF